MSAAKKTCISAVCVALCCILPTMFHSVGLGTAFSPIHIPVLLCGLTCGGTYGLICGVLGPVLSCLITGMPGAPLLVSMVPELMTYGLVTGLLMKRIHTGKSWLDLYLALGAAMLLGRIVGGIAKALFYLGTGQAFTLTLWVTGYFVTTLPGILCHLILVPVLVAALKRAKVVPSRI